ncbi:DUF1833 family protein [Vreelandella titanicae]|uniref:DUF1833 family protein n=1 Tax=Vreelandella titanicae TaxID=664683 RepID=UPI0039BFAFD1
MTILAEIHSGHDPTIYRIPALELTCPAWSTAIRNIPGWDDLLLRHEDGQQFEYIGSGLDIALPARNDSGQQRLVFALGGANSEAEDLVEQATEAGEIITLTLRMFASNDLDAPAQRPKIMIVDSPEFLPNGVLQVPCTYRDILSRRFLKGRFTAGKYPGVALF